MVLWLIGFMSRKGAHAFVPLKVLKGLRETTGGFSRQLYTSNIVRSSASRQLPVANSANGDAIYEQERTTKLLISLLVDLIGFSSFALPLAGEAGDIAWAPIFAVILQYLYGNSLITGLGFAEELLPGFDFIPTACIGWLLTYYGTNNEPGVPPAQGGGTKSESSVPSAPGGGLVESGKSADDDVIDI